MVRGASPCLYLPVAMVSPPSVTRGRAVRISEGRSHEPTVRPPPGEALLQLKETGWGCHIDVGRNSQSSSSTVPPRRGRTTTPGPPRRLPRRTPPAPVWCAPVVTVLEFSGQGEGAGGGRRPRVNNSTFYKCQTPAYTSILCPWIDITGSSILLSSVDPSVTL